MSESNVMIILSLIKMLGQLTIAIVESKNEFDSLVSEVQRMVRNNEDPPEELFQRVTDLINLQNSKLQGLDILNKSEETQTSG